MIAIKLPGTTEAHYHREYSVHFWSLRISLPLLLSYIRACCHEVMIKQEVNSILNTESGVWQKGNFSFPHAKFPTAKLGSEQSTCSTWGSSCPGADICIVDHCLCSFLHCKDWCLLILPSFGGLKWVRLVMHGFFLGVRRELARPETGIQSWPSRIPSLVLN